MSSNLATLILTGVFFFAPPPVEAITGSDSVFAQVEETGKGPEGVNFDKEKPSKPEKGEKKSKEKKKYDDFKDKNGNGIDDRFEKKEPSKKKKKGEPGEVNF